MALARDRRAAARDGLEMKMTPQQIAEAERRAREWKPAQSPPAESVSRGSDQLPTGASPQPARQAQKVSAETAPGTIPVTGVAPNNTANGGSCVTYGRIASYKSYTPGFDQPISGTLYPSKLAQYMHWYTELDSTACKHLPLVFQVTVHSYQDQAETIEVPLPPDQQTSLNFLIERNEKVTIHGEVRVPLQAAKQSNWTGVRAQTIVTDAGPALIRSLQEAQVSNPGFCDHYAALRYTGKMTPYKKGVGSFPELVPDPSKGVCLKARAIVMAERFMNEHAEITSVTGVVLCPDSKCVQSHLDSTVPNTTNVSKFIEGAFVHNAVRTFESVKPTCENPGEPGAQKLTVENSGQDCLVKGMYGYGHWAVTGAMNEAMHVTSSSQPDYDELNIYNFTCTASVNPLRTHSNEAGPKDTHDMVSKGQIVAGKHSANDSYVTCSTQRTK